MDRDPPAGEPRVCVESQRRPCRSGTSRPKPRSLGQMAGKRKVERPIRGRIRLPTCCAAHAYPTGRASSVMAVPSAALTSTDTENSVARLR